LPQHRQSELARVIPQEALSSVGATHLVVLDEEVVSLSGWTVVVKVLAVLPQQQHCADRNPNRVDQDAKDVGNATECNVRVTGAADLQIDFHPRFIFVKAHTGETLEPARQSCTCGRLRSVAQQMTNDSYDIVVDG
jgi:hypothetical protein